MDRRGLLTSAVAGWLSAAVPAAAYQTQVMTPWGPAIEVGVPKSDWLSIYASQERSMWCWAASLQMLFAAAGRSVSQRQIVMATYGQLVNLPSFSARNIAALSNRDWVDAQGETFSSRLVAAYDAHAGIAAIDNNTIVDALARETPMIVCNRTHAMLLTAATFVPTPYGANILSLGVFDPWPGRGARGADHPDEFTAIHQGGDLTYVGLAVVD